MLAQRYSVPGVYFEWLDQPQAAGGWRMDIAGFVGFAPSGPLHEATRIESWTQYVSVFGGVSPFFLGYAVRGFFDNGGQECHVVRVADPDRARTASRVFLDEYGDPVFSLEATSPGAWPHGMDIVLRPTGTKRFSLILHWADRRQGVWHNLSYETRAGLEKMQEIVNHTVTGSKLIRVCLEPAWSVDGVELAAMSTGSPITTALTGGEDGLSTVTLPHLTGVGAPPDRRWGLAALELVDQVSIVAMPDLMYRPGPEPEPIRPRVLCDAPYTDRPRVPARSALAQPSERPAGLSDDQIIAAQQHLIAHCIQLRDRVALLDSLPGAVLPEQVIEQRHQFDSSYAALYYPWLRVADADNRLVAVPACGHVAGIYARTDRRVGVHKPPANEALENVSDLAASIDDPLHRVLYDQQVNVIRQVAGRGIRVMGAATLFTEDGRRFVNVRRLLIMIQERINEDTQWMAFENNSPALWADLRREIRALLDLLWQRGMLEGGLATEAYSVRCDTSTMTEDDIVNGRLVCEIGVNPPWPAEFVIVRVGKTSSSSPLTEMGYG